MHSIVFFSGNLTVRLKAAAAAAAPNRCYARDRWWQNESDNVVTVWFVFRQNSCNIWNGNWKHKAYWAFWISCRLRHNFRVCSKCDGITITLVPWDMALHLQNSYLCMTVGMMGLVIPYDGLVGGDGGAAVVSFRDHIPLIGWISFSYCLRICAVSSFLHWFHANSIFCCCCWCCELLHRRHPSHCV